jgi:hypothetical protein
VRGRIFAGGADDDAVAGDEGEVAGVKCPKRDLRMLFR